MESNDFSFLFRLVQSKVLWLVRHDLTKGLRFKLEPPELVRAVASCTKAGVLTFLRASRSSLLWTWLQAFGRYLVWKYIHLPVWRKQANRSRKSHLQSILLHKVSKLYGRQSTISQAYPLFFERDSPYLTKKNCSTSSSSTMGTRTYALNGAARKSCSNSCLLSFAIATKAIWIVAWLQQQSCLAARLQWSRLPFLEKIPLALLASQHFHIQSWDHYSPRCFGVFPSTFRHGFDPVSCWPLSVSGQVMWLHWLWQMFWFRVCKGLSDVY